MKNDKDKICLGDRVQVICVDGYVPSRKVFLNKVAKVIKTHKDDANSYILLKFENPEIEKINKQYRSIYCWIEKDLLKIIEKEVTNLENELTLVEVLQNIKDGEMYKCTDLTHNIESISKGLGVTHFKWHRESYGTTINDIARFVKEMVYMTFYEAKEKGMPCHKDNGDDWGAWNHKEFLEEMDKKVWYVE